MKTVNGFTLRGSSWLVTYDSPFRSEKVQDSPHFPMQFLRFNYRDSSVGLGMRVVREL